MKANQRIGKNHERKQCGKGLEVLFVIHIGRWYKGIRDQIFKFSKERHKTTVALL